MHITNPGEWSDKDLLEEIDEEGRNLTAWEIEFVEDLTRQVKSGIRLSPTQREKLCQIIDERCPE